MPTHKPNAADLAEVRKTLSDTITAFEANKVFAGKVAGADAKKNRKLQNNVIAAYKASLKAVDDGDYTKAKEHADAAVKAVESAGGIIPATQVGAHGEGATVIYTSGGAKANHIGTLHIAAKVGGLSEKKAPTANKEKGPEGGSKKGETQGGKAKDSGESNYPTPSLRKGQELAHIDYTLDGKKIKIPIAAYPVESTPHLVVHRAFDVTKDGVKVESDGWVITQKDTGLRIASSYKGTLKGGRELAEEIGKHGDWKDEQTAQDTVPKEVTMALGGLAKGQDAGNLDKAIDSVKKVEGKEAAGKTDKDPPTGKEGVAGDADLPGLDDKKPYGPGWVSPKGETWESLDTETQEWLKKTRAEIAESKDKFDKREKLLKEFEKQKPYLEKLDDVNYVYSNGFIMLKDGKVVAYDESWRERAESLKKKDESPPTDEKHKDGAAGEAPKAKTDKEGYITLDGKMFGRAKKSAAPQGDPTPWTVEVYRGTERAYVKGKTKKEAVDEALKQWGSVPVLYQGHKGPGVGILKPDAPSRRDGDKDTVVAERRPRKSEKHPKSPIKLSDYGELQDAIQDYTQTASVPKKKNPSAEKLMGYRSAKKKSHYTPKAGRGGSEMKAAKK